MGINKTTNQDFWTLTILFSIIYVLVGIAISMIYIPTTTKNMILISGITNILGFFLPAIVFKNLLSSKKIKWNNKIPIYYTQNIIKYIIILFLCLCTTWILSSITVALSRYLLTFLQQFFHVGSISDYTETIIKNFIPKEIDDYLILFVVVCIIPAFSEELFFRGTLQVILIRMLPRRPFMAILITSIIFSLIHMSAIGFLSRIIIGFFLGFVYYKSRNIYITIAIHFINNFIGLLLILWKM